MNWFLLLTSSVLYLVLGVVQGQLPTDYWKLPIGTVSSRIGMWLNTSGNPILHTELDYASVEAWIESQPEIANVTDFAQRITSIDNPLSGSLHQKNGLIFASFHVSLPIGWKQNRRILENDRLAPQLNALFQRVTTAGDLTINVSLKNGTAVNNVPVIIGDMSAEQRVPYRYGEICTFFNFCSVHNGECRDDGTNTGTKRCQCLGSYIATSVIKQEAWPECKLKISYRDDPNCAACEKPQGHGVCYASGSDRKYSGCACPNTRSGDLCENNYVDVSCTNEDMTICFKPFDENYASFFAGNNSLANLLRPKQDYLTPEASIFFKDKKNYPSCEFKENFSRCQPGEWGITLSTLDKDLGVCKLNKYRRAGQLYYENTVIVDVPHVVLDVHFNAFCAFKETFDKKSGLNVKVPIGGETGTYESARVDMSIRNLNNDNLMDGASVYEGDQLFVRFDMTDPRGLFRAIRVEYCTASTHQSLGHPSATHQQLLVQSCPAPSQYYLTSSSNFQPIGGDVTELQTRPNGIFAFRIGNSASWYLHCTVRVCQQLQECQRVTCADGGGGYGKRRRRRAAAAGDSGTVQLTHEFTVLKQDDKKARKKDAGSPNNPVGPQINDQGTVAHQKWLLPAIGGMAFLILAMFVMMSVFGYRMNQKTIKVSPEDVTDEYNPDRVKIPPQMLQVQENEQPEVLPRHAVSAKSLARRGSL